MAQSALQQVSWDLEHLVDGKGEAGAEKLLADAKKRADAFAKKYAGKIAELDGPGLAKLMTELGSISELAGRAGNYAHLRFAADTADPANGALVARVNERSTAIETQLLFFDLE